MNSLSGSLSWGSNRAKKTKVHKHLHPIIELPLGLHTLMQIRYPVLLTPQEKEYAGSCAWPLVRW